MQDSAGSSLVTPARAEDAAEIAAFVNGAYRGESSKLGWTTEADFLDGQRTDADLILEEIVHPHRLMLCLRSSINGELLGTVLLEKFEVDGQVGCYLGMLTTRPDLQNTGLGKRLMLAGEHQAREWNCDHMVLNVISQRATLIAWYERHGYRDTGKTKPFPYGQEQFGVPKVEGLHFRLFRKNL